MRIIQITSYVLLLFFTLTRINFPQNAVIDEPAPGFTLIDNEDSTYSLSDFSDEFVVLEWINFGCPFVKKHYSSGNMPNLQKKYTEIGVKWFAICSSAPGKQGYLDNNEINEKLEDYSASLTAYLRDESGDVGRMYGAKTTPHMYIINPGGILIYAGGIDDIPSTDIDDIEEAFNYVSAALDEAIAGEEVSTKVSTPYGCSVKY